MVLGDMQLIRKYNEIFRFSLCVFKVYKKYAAVVPLKGKKKFKIKSLVEKN